MPAVFLLVGDLVHVTEPLGYTLVAPIYHYLDIIVKLDLLIPDGRGSSS